MIKAAARGRLPPPAAGCGYTVLMMVVATNDAVFRFQLIRPEQLAVGKPGLAGKRLGNAAHDGKVPKPLRTEQLDCQHQ